jgi:hypothetical protein
MHLMLLLFWALSPDALASSAAHLFPDVRSAGGNVRAHEFDAARLTQTPTSTLATKEQRDHRHRELAESARRAAGLLAERQQSPGYWLTAHTREARFETPRQELNTFTNAVMVDIAGPVAEAAGITGPLGRTRAFLANQIEADGLVRYHGRPDAPTMWKLGCVITPDADDTALVWRIAPGAPRELLSKALATLGQFRGTDGLYKTWLAPQDRYQCIDPGANPNPADIGIQMHVLMLLAQVDRPAALALCGALVREASDDKLWVYYAMAPLIPMLRLTDLHKMGCRPQLPQARLQTAVPGQGVWVEIVHLLGRMEEARALPAEYSRAADLLHQLAADEFSLIKSAPPLLYHNDLTAHVRRFYWSEDVGYALWLRLYFVSERARPGARERAPA